MQPNRNPWARGCVLVLLLAFLAACQAATPSARPDHLLRGTATDAGTPMRDCDPEMLATLHQVEIPAPADGWSGTPQAVNVFNVFAGEVMIGLGDRVVCGRMHDARSRDSRFRAGVGMVVVPEAGTDSPVRVGWVPPVKAHWIPTIRIGGPSPVQQEDTLRLVVRTACLAVALALAFSALMGFIGARDRIFLAHVAMCLVLLLWQASLNGLSGYPTPWLPVGQYEAWWQVALTAFGAAALLYGLWSQSGSLGRAAGWRKAVRRGIWLLAAAGLLVPLLPASALRGAWSVVDGGFAVAALALMYVAWRSIRDGDRRACAAIIAVLPFLALFVPQIATSRVVVEYRVEIIQLVLTWFLIVMAYTLTNGYGQLRAQRDAMQQLADTDALTGLLNRRAGMTRLGDWFARPHDAAAPLSVGFVDVDLFKRINDTHGHDAGDRVLVAVAGALLAEVGQRDAVARMGGEEFLVMLPGMPAYAARTRLEAVRQRIANAAQGLGVPGLELTVSIGMTTRVAGDEDPVALLRRADDAMYQAKHAGRDQVVDDHAPSLRLDARR